MRDKYWVMREGTFHMREGKGDMCVREGGRLCVKCYANQFESYSIFAFFHEVIRGPWRDLKFNISFLNSLLHL